jgi:hypothetical protein
VTANFDCALYWHGRGFNCVPQARGFEKHPGVKWKHLQTRRVTEAELCRWRFMFERGVGFVTGAISNTIVIETDGAEGEALLDGFERLNGPLPPTLTIRSGSGRGLHRHFQHPGHYVVTRANPAIKVDIKGDAGFCVLPPSLHKSGGRYEIIRNAPPAKLPKDLLDFIETRAAMANGLERGPLASPRNRVGANTPILDCLERGFHPIAPAPPVCPLEKVIEVVAKYWPRNGGRHAGALVFGGVLFRAGYDVDAIGEIVKSAAGLAGDEEVADRVLAACSAAANYEAGGEISGIPMLRQTFGDGCANGLIGLLDLDGGDGEWRPRQRAGPNEKARRRLLGVSPQSIRAVRRALGHL